MGGYVFHAETADIVQSHGQSVRADIVWRTGFELVWELLIGRLGKRDVRNHLAAALIGRQAVKPVFAAVEHTDACGPIDLVPAECEEVTADVGHVDRKVGDALCAVYKDRHVVGMGDGGEFLDRIDSPQYVAHVRHRHQACAGGEQLFIGFEVELACFVDRYDLNDNAFSVAEHLPRHNVRMMLHRAEYDFIAGLHAGLAETRRDKVEAFCRAACEDDFVARPGAYKAGHAFTGLFVEFGGLL